MRTPKYYVGIFKTGLTPIEEIFETAMKEAYNQALEDVLPKVELQLRNYNQDGSFEAASLGQEVMEQEPKIYIGISKESILNLKK